MESISSQFKYTEYSPSKFETKRQQFVENRLQSMDTKYRKSLIEMAHLGRDAVDGIATDEDRVSNAELFKIPISYAVIMQRMSTLADNPSKAIYKTEGQDKSKLLVAEQMNKHDKIAGRYDASYIDFMLTAETEAICFVKQGWHEEFKQVGNKNVTIGKMYCSQDKLLIENFYWDPAANELRGEKGSVANDAMDREFMSILDLRLRYGNNENYKNINSVKACNGSDVAFFNHVTGSKPVEEKTLAHGEIAAAEPIGDVGKEVVKWNYYCRNFYDEETGKITDVLLEYANGVEIRKTEIPGPKINGKAVLPYLKFVAIPTSGMGGISIPAIIRHPEKALQRMVTMADAQAELAINPVTYMSSSIIDTLDEAPLFPGSRVEVAMQGRSVADEIYVQTMPDITNGAQYIIDKMLQLIVMITGVDIHALFESPKTKAVSTERKREIQEKLLRFSVIYNEIHGFYDLEEMRLHLMLQNYPIKRWVYEKQEDGTEKIVKRYPQIPVNGFQVKIIEGDESKNADQQRNKLISSPKSFSLLTINPVNIDYNIHLYIEGATNAANDDTFKLNKNIEKANLLASNPWTSSVIDPMKASRNIFRWLNVEEDEWIKEELEKSNSDMHGAMKEIQAIMLKDIMDVQIKLDDDYDATEYVDVFSRFMSLEQFKKISPAVNAAFMERYQFHLKNSLNPYYKEELAAAKQAEASGANVPGAEGMPIGGEGEPQGTGTPAPGASPARSAKAANKLVVPEPNPNELSGTVNSKAGTLGKAGKLKVANSREQKRIY